MNRIAVIIASWSFIACVSTNSKKPIFEDVAASAGVIFRNDLELTEHVNPYTFRNFFNGGGVAVGDINNDGFLDIYLTSNQSGNRLFLNNGNFTFTDVTDQAGVSCAGSWSTGVSFVDINGDGWLDIYVCKSGPPDTPKRFNELFINNKDLTFSEQAAKFGLDVKGLSVQAVFFDFDRDNDLDCYLLTNSFRSVGAYDLIPGLREIPDSEGGGNKFFVNENNFFFDKAAELGIYSSAIGFGLGVTLGDFNSDSWTDIFVSNDFFERDYLYLNQHGRGFVDSLTQYFQSISAGSMGADFADLDNDGSGELFVTEMLPDSLHRKKTKTLFEGWSRYELAVQNGYHHQFSRNVLQKKMGNNFFGEIGRFANVAASEWSWGALIFDMDNDGWKDIFVASGITRDLLDRDYLSFSNDPENVRKLMATEQDAVIQLIERMPTSRFVNYAWHNQKGLSFENKTKDWGFGSPGFSNGSAYGDLDNDGDLDLIVNCINSPARVYKNNIDTATHRSLSFRFISNSKNTLAIGTKVHVFSSGELLVADNFPNRGYQSFSQPSITIGVGSRSQVDSVVIVWPDNTDTTLQQLPTNSSWVILKGKESVPSRTKRNLATNALIRLELRPERLFAHKSNSINDFDREPLLTEMYSNEIPKLILTGDSKPGVYVGGGAGQHGVFISWNGNSFVSKEFNTNWSAVEETRSAMCDVDGDGDRDFIFASGGRLYPSISDLQVDRLFLQTAPGVFRESMQSSLAASGFATSAVIPMDFDRDNDVDLIALERFDPSIYGRGGGLHFFANDGLGNYTDVGDTQTQEVRKVGMVTDAVATDFNNDGWEDLLVVGDWMPITLLVNKNGKFSVTPVPGLAGQKTEGWWHCIHSADLNQDKLPDFVVGNHGLNSFAKPGDRLWVGDFDSNGSFEQIYTTYQGGKHYPVHDRDELTARIPSLKKLALRYKDYAELSIQELFPNLNFERVFFHEVNMLASVMLLSDKNGNYRLEPMPNEAQFSSIYAVTTADLDGDTLLDVIVGGNQYYVKPQYGRQDASPAWWFRGSRDSKSFKLEAGVALGVRGQIRDIAYLAAENGRQFLFFAKYGDDLEIYEIYRQ